MKNTVISQTDTIIDVFCPLKRGRGVWTMQIFLVDLTLTIRTLFSKKIWFTQKFPKHDNLPHNLTIYASFDQLAWVAFLQSVILTETRNLRISLLQLTSNFCRIRLTKTFSFKASKRQPSCSDPRAVCFILKIIFFGGKERFERVSMRLWLIRLDSVGWVFSYDW